MKLTMIDGVLRYNLYYFLLKFSLIKKNNWIQTNDVLFNKLFSITFKQNSLGWLIIVVRNLTGQVQLFLYIYLYHDFVVCFLMALQKKSYSYLLTLVIGKGDSNCVSWQDMYGSQYYRKSVCFLVKIVVRFRIGF